MELTLNGRVCFDAQEKTLSCLTFMSLLASLPVPLHSNYKLKVISHRKWLLCWLMRVY